MRFDRRTPPWAVVLLAAVFGAFIWALSPAIAGRNEPWDANSAYYLLALPIGGFVTGLLAGRPLWAHYVGVIGGQFLYGLLFLSIGPLMLLGVAFLAVYGLLFLAGSLLGFKVRGVLAAQDEGPRRHLQLVEPAGGKRFLEHYGGQRAEELVGLQEGYRIDSIVLAFEEALLLKQSGTTLSRDERYVLAIAALEREVSGGGYAQFLLNPSRELADIVVEALKAIECPKAAMITQEAIDTVARDAVLSETRVIVAMGDLTVRRRLAECDTLYASNDESITEQLFRWIETYPGKISIGS